MRKSSEIFTREVFTSFGIWNHLKKSSEKKFTYPRGVFNTTEFAITWEKSPEPIFITLEVFHSYEIWNQLRKESGRNFSPSVFTRMESEDVIPSPFSENDFSFSKNAADATFIFSFSYNWCHKPPPNKRIQERKNFLVLLKGCRSTAAVRPLIFLKLSLKKFLQMVHLLIRRRLEERIKCKFRKCNNMIMMNWGAWMDFQSKILFP